MAEKHLKMRICRIFRSCKSKHYIIDDVLDTHHHQLMEENPIFSPKLPPHPYTINNNYNHRIITNNKTYSYYHQIFHPDGRKCPPTSPIYFQPDGRKCPPASPIIQPLNPKSTLLPKLYTTNSTKYHRGFDAFEEEDERNRGALRRRKAAEDEIMSLAVVKRSNDPYADFRVSMLEMIVQNQIFAAKDLRNLLRCFLALNSCHYHNLILQVFDEISQALLREL